MLAYTGRGKSGFLELMRQQQHEESLTAAAETDDDPAARVDAQVAKLVAAHRPGTPIDMDPDCYKSYVRPRLIVSPDPAAAVLMSELDRRFGLA